MATKLPILAITAASYGAVFGFFGRFLAKTWVWILLAWTASFALNLAVELLFPPALIKLAGMASAYLLTLPIFAGAAVLWHRTIQLGEDRRGWRAIRLRGREWFYLAAEIGLVLFVLSPLGLSHLFRALSMDGFAAFLALPFLLIGFLYLGLRSVLCLPLIAIGETVVLSQSWRLMKGNLLRLIATGILVLGPMALLTSFLSRIADFAMAFALRDATFYPVALLLQGPAAAGGIMMAGMFASMLSYALLHRRELSIGQSPGTLPSPVGVPSSSTLPSQPSNARPPAGGTPAGKLPVGQIASTAYALVFHPLRACLARTWAWMLVMASVGALAVLLQSALPLAVREYGLKWYILMPISYGIAVMWYRWILLGEDRRGWRAVRFPAAVWKMLGIFLLFFIATFLPLILLAEMAKIAIPGNDYSQLRPAAMIPFLLFMPIALILSGTFFYIALRLMLFQPLVAIGESHVFDTSWRLMKGNLWRMIIIITLVGAPIGIANMALSNLQEESIKVGFALVVLIEFVMAPLNVIGGCLAASAAALILLQRRGLPFPQR